MSFSKSKVERFPSSNGGPTIKLLERKRPYMYSSLSTSMSNLSFQRTPTNKENRKKKISSKNVSISNSTGSLKKCPVERISSLTRGGKNRMIMSRPSSSPTVRGNLVVNSKNNVKPRDNKTPLNRKHVLPSKKVSKNSHSLQHTPKRKKFDEMSSESYETPPTSPRLSPNKTTDSFHSFVILKPDSEQHDGAEKQQFTPYPLESTRFIGTPCPLESTRLTDTPVQAAWRDFTVMSINDNADETRNYASEESNDLENTTVTTPGRKPMRRSFPRQSLINDAAILTQSPGYTSSSVPMSRMSLLNLDDGQRTGIVEQLSLSGLNPSFDLLNNAFMQLSLQDPEPENSGQSYPTAGLAPGFWNFGGSSQRGQTFYWDDITCPVPYSTENVPAQSSSLFDWIGNMLSIVSNKIKPSRRILVGESSSGLNDLLDTSDSYPVSKRQNQHHRQNNAPITSRGFNLGRFTHFRPSKEMRKLLRTVRIETRHTMRNVRISIIAPAKV